MTFINPQYLVETAWLEAHLNDPALRILDCTVLFATDTNGVRVASGRDAWTQGHIPGSGFADLMQDLSDRNSPVPFMMPPATQFAEAMSRYGIGDGLGMVHMSSSMTLVAICGRICGRLVSGGCCACAVLIRPPS
jgi:thiosulfate/3-mercaptopyruvate sulfurtransferase